MQSYIPEVYLLAYLLCTTDPFLNLLRMAETHLDGSACNLPQVFLMLASQSKTKIILLPWGKSFFLYATFVSC